MVKKVAEVAAEADVLEVQKLPDHVKEAVVVELWAGKEMEEVEVEVEVEEHDEDSAFQKYNSAVNKNVEQAANRVHFEVDTYKN